MKLVWCITESYPDDDFSIHSEYNHDEFEKAKDDLIEYSKEWDYDFEEPMYLAEMTKRPVSDFFPDNEYLYNNMKESIEEAIVERVGNWFQTDEEDKKAMQEIISNCIVELKKLPVFSMEVYSANIGKDYTLIYTVDEETGELI